MFDGQDLPIDKLRNGSISLEAFIGNFIGVVTGAFPDVGHVIVVFDNTDTENTVGMGNIAGVRDMNRCVELLENYVETLKAGIPALH